MYSLSLFSVTVVVGIEVEVVDRCAVGNGGCDHVCRRSGAGNDVICSCHAGYRLQANMESCAGLSLCLSVSVCLSVCCRRRRRVSTSLLSYIIFIFIIIIFCFIRQLSKVHDFRNRKWHFFLRGMQWNGSFVSLIWWSVISPEIDLRMLSERKLSCCRSEM